MQLKHFDSDKQYIQGDLQSRHTKLSEYPISNAIALYVILAGQDT